MEEWNREGVDRICKQNCGLLSLCISELIPAFLLRLLENVGEIEEIEGRENLLLAWVNYRFFIPSLCTTFQPFLGLELTMDQRLCWITKLYIVDRIGGMLRDKNPAANYLNRCTYSVGRGGNDYNDNYFMSQLYPASRIHTPQNNMPRFLFNVFLSY